MGEDLEKEAESRAVRHETRDINARAVGCFGVALVVCAVIMSVLLGGLFHRFGDRNPTGTAANRIAIGPSNAAPAAPRLQSNPAREMEEFRAREDVILNSYGWVDRQAGVVRIPIDRAMEIIAQRGLAPPKNSVSRTPIQMRQERAQAKKEPP